MGNQNHKDTCTGQRSNDSNKIQDPELRSMRRSLREDQESFILNNLMLCVQFFENYERELKDIRSRTISPRENDMNKILSRSQKHALLPGILEEQVSSHVKFSSKEITGYESTIEPIQPVRVYVVLDNVHVNKIAKIPNERTSVDPISYEMHLEPSSNHGYVRLRLLEETQTPKEQVPEISELDLPQIAEGDDEINNEEEDASKLIEQNYTQSMINLCNIDKNGETARLSMDRSLSQTNMVHQEHSDDEGYQELTYSGTPESRLGGPLRQSRQFGTRLQSIQPQKRGSMESMPRSSMSSGCKPGSDGRSSAIYSDSGYGFTASTSSITSKSSMGLIELPVSSSEIPVSCFVKEEQPQKLTEKKMRNAKPNRKENPSYLRSYKFIQYFQELVVKRLAKRLGFENEYDTDVTRKGAIIHCLSMKICDKNLTLVTPHEIMPCISSEWPEFCSEWLQRVTNSVLDFPNEETWLTKERIKEVKKLGCHMIPVSCPPTKAINLSGNLAVDWQLTFPAAERYLETCLSRSQAQVYMMALLLRKTFIRSKNRRFALTSSHIRHQLFWLLEQNYSPSMWDENRSGESLKILLNKLYRGVARSQPHLADYFISKKNLFANFRIGYLNMIHYQIKSIIENPILYLIMAMTRIRYKTNFFPVMDYERLYKLLTIDETDLSAFVNFGISPESEKEEEQCDEINTRYGSATRILHQRAELYGSRLIAVLSMFIEHFTKMAKSCYYYGTMDLKDLYLNQAYMLSMILQKQTLGKEDAETYLSTIKTLKQELSHFVTQEGVPETSAQTDLPAFSMPFNQLHVDESDRQGIRLFGPHTGETNEYDIHPASVKLDRINTLKQELSHISTQEGVFRTSVQSDLPAFNMPFNQLYVDQSDRQEMRLFGPHTSETNEFDIHSAPVEIRKNVNSEQTTDL